MTTYRCKYCGEIDESPNVLNHIKCADRYMFEEINTKKYNIYFKPIILEEEDETAVRALYDNNFYRNHKPEIDRMELVTDE